MHAGAPANVQLDLAQHGELLLRKHEVFPAGECLDPLREVVEARARVAAARVPERGVQLVAAGERLRARRLDRQRPEVEVGDERIHGAVELVGAQAERAGPQRALLRGAEARHLQANGGAPKVGERLASAHDEEAVERVREHGRPSADVRVGIVIDFEQQGVPREHRLAPPHATEGFPLGCDGRHVARPQGVDEEAEPRAGGGCDGPP